MFGGGVNLSLNNLYSGYDQVLGGLSYNQPNYTNSIFGNQSRDPLAGNQFNDPSGQMQMMSVLFMLIFMSSMLNNQTQQNNFGLAQNNYNGNYPSNYNGNYQNDPWGNLLASLNPGNNHQNNWNNINNPNMDAFFRNPMNNSSMGCGAGQSSTAQRAIETAYNELGNKCGNKYGETGAWCAAFIKWTEVQANGANAPDFVKSHSVSENERRAAKAGYLTKDLSGLESGDLVTFEKWSHIERVVKVDYQRGVAITIGGNTKGGQVAQRERPLSSLKNRIALNAYYRDRGIS